MDIYGFVTGVWPLSVWELVKQSRKAVVVASHVRV